MNKLFLLLFLLVGYNTNAQDLPTKPANGFSFPIGSKFTIKLFPTDSTHFDYSIVKYEPFQDVVDTWENDQLFEDEGEKGTIDFYFCLGTSGKTEEEKEKNMKVLLLMKNRTEFALKYNSDIQRTENGELEETSNIGTFPGAKGNEMWPYMIYQIGLNGFMIMQ